MTNNTTKPDSLQPAAEKAGDLFDNWFDPIETEVRARAREFIEELIRGELDTALARPRYQRSKIAGNEAGACVTGHRHGSRTRSLTGTFGPIEIAVPRARARTSASIGSNQLSKRSTAISVEGCEESGFVVVLVMAWSPGRRFNAG